MTREEFLSLLGIGIVEVRFIKKDGTIRTMKATLDFSQIPSTLKPKGKSSRKTTNIISVFDVEKKAWRSINLLTVLEVKVGDKIVFKARTQKLS